MCLPTNEAVAILVVLVGITSHHDRWDDEVSMNILAGIVL
jgi:hypothetical protein